MMNSRSAPSSRPKRSKRKSTLNVAVEIIWTFIRKSAFAITLYSMGYYQVSVYWLAAPILFSVIVSFLMEPDDERIKSRKAMALAGDQELILSQYNKLPPWVSFPDIERAEWINTIIQQLWPTVNNYIRIYLLETLQPELEQQLRQYMLNGFQFETVKLGSIPPKITGIKVYQKTSEDEIIMDVHLLYGGNCELSFYLSGTTAGIRDFQMESELRFIMKPLIPTAPLIGGMQIFFIETPVFDFQMIGITKILQMPGINSYLRETIESVIESMAVIPNMFTMEFSDDNEISTYLRVPDPSGVLRIHLIEAENLEAKDYIGTSDPYVIVEVGAQRFRSKTISRSLNPTFDSWCEFAIIEPYGQKLRFRVWDEDYGRPDDFLGNALVDLSFIMEKQYLDMWLTLEDAEHGSLHVELFWYHLSNRIQDLPAIVKENGNKFPSDVRLSTAVLTVFVHSASNLTSPGEQPDACVKLQMGPTTKTTHVCKLSTDPVWREGFCFLVSNPNEETLKLTIIDSKSKQELGELNFQVKKFQDKKISNSKSSRSN
ncbi:hypothetical protein WA026_022034 [Henosepilachna vigintioctopunctata]|uniref:Uncharacterized protein n=1 Tax=Henosepilachna vigintioctopunctata TaxID=420089 RepID=A0AAW1UV62_9CUCU